MAVKVLITGAAGNIGRVVVEALKGTFDLRGFDREPMPELDDSIQGNLTDADKILEATKGMEVVVHLAACVGGACEWDDVLHSNIIGTYNVFEAARQCGVRRIAFASRAGILAAYPENLTRTIDMPPKPMDYYTISKLFGENMGYMYSVKHGMEIVCVRIGGFNIEVTDVTHPHQLSPKDAGIVFKRAVEAEGVKFEIVFGVSDSNWPLYDLEHGKKTIGYLPQDRSEVTRET